LQLPQTDTGNCPCAVSNAHLSTSEHSAPASTPAGDFRLRGGMTTPRCTWLLAVQALIARSEFQSLGSASLRQSTAHSGLGVPAHRVRRLDSSHCVLPLLSRAILPWTWLKQSCSRPPSACRTPAAALEGSSPGVVRSATHSLVAAMKSKLPLMS